MNKPYKNIVNETAFCITHLNGKVGRNNKTMKWAFQCFRGWQHRANGKPSGCRIIIEKGLVGK